MYARAVQTSPSIRTQPTPSLFAIRSSTVALLPTSAAVPVRSCGGMRRCERASGRSAASRTSETTQEDGERADERHAGGADDGRDRGAAGERRQEEAERRDLAHAEDHGEDQPEQPVFHWPDRTPAARR